MHDPIMEEAVLPGEYDRTKEEFQKGFYHGFTNNHS